MKGIGISSLNDQAAADDTWMPRYLNRKNYEEWKAEGSPSMNQKIKDEVEPNFLNVTSGANRHWCWP